MNIKALSQLIIGFCALLGALSNLVVACGNIATASPTLNKAAAATATPIAQISTYTDATPVNLPDVMFTNFQARIQSSKLKNAKIDAYKSSNTINRIVSDISKGFKENGWADETELLSKTEAANLMAYSLSSLGSYLVFTSNNSQVASIVLTPGLALNGSIKDISDKDILILEFIGDIS